MRRWFFILLCCAAFLPTAGCFLPAFSANRAHRTQQLIFTAEDFRTVLKTWERFWFLDQPDHMNPDLVHGGVL